MSKLRDIEERLKDLQLTNKESFTLHRLDSIREFVEMEDKLAQEPEYQEKLVWLMNL